MCTVSRPTGGTPMPVAADRYTTEYFAAPAPTGGAIAITARANAGSQWWRKGHSHLDESEIWIVKDAATPLYQPVTKGGAKDAWPMWSADGKTLYFMSDRSGAQNSGARRRQAHGAKALTTFKDGRVLWPTISKDGKTIAFERDFGIWTLDTAGGSPRELTVALRGAPASAAIEHRTFTDQIQELAISPDGKKAAFTVRGEIFSASAKDGGDAVRVTSTAGEESELTWAPDSRRLAYISHRDGTNHLFLYDFGSGKETQLTSGAGRDNMPRFSPDGKLIAFERNSRELRVIDPATKAERVVATGLFDTPPFADARDFEWSPDSKYIAFLSAGAKTFQNINIVPVAGGEARQATFLANTNAGFGVVEPGRHVSDVHDGAAHGAGERDPRRPDSAHAEVPRGSVPRSVPRRAAEDAATARPRFSSLARGRHPLVPSLSTAEAAGR